MLSIGFEPLSKEKPRLRSGGRYQPGFSLIAELKQPSAEWNQSRALNSVWLGLIISLDISKIRTLQRFTPIADLPTLLAGLLLRTIATVPRSLSVVHIHLGTVTLKPSRPIAFCMGPSYNLMLELTLSGEANRHISEAEATQLELALTDKVKSQIATPRSEGALRRMIEEDARGSPIMIN